MTDWLACLLCGIRIARLTAPDWLMYPFPEFEIVDDSCINSSSGCVCAARAGRLCVCCFAVPRLGMLFQLFASKDDAGTRRVLHGLGLWQDTYAGAGYHDMKMMLQLGFCFGAVLVAQA